MRRFYQRNHFGIIHNIGFLILCQIVNHIALRSNTYIFNKMGKELGLMVKKLSLSPRKIFFIDGLGGFFTAFILIFIIARFESYFGIPSHIVYILGFIGCFYMVYAIGCYLLIKRNYKPYLKFIAFANLFYCCLTFGLVCYFYTRLTVLGLAYFLLEIMIIISLVFVEKMIADSIA